MKRTVRDLVVDVAAWRCGDLQWVVVVAMLLATSIPALAQGPQRPQLQTHEMYMEDVQRQTELRVDDPTALFAFVLGSLPDRVKVFPTENYFYFRFLHNGQPYAGNIRLDPRDRDQGKVHFGYYQDLSEWKDEGLDGYLILDESRGVKVERLERLVYRITQGAKSVVFALNDLSDVKPPATAMGPDDKFLGPIFDDSGIRFFFVFNTRLKIFQYVLDETVRTADEFYAAAKTDRIVIGRRTGFAYYRDHHLDRKILIGVFETNSFVNNYLDGPFDQLPENFIEGEELREAIIASDPSARGKIGRLGHYADGEQRYLVDPYVLYRQESDLLRIHACATANRKRPGYHRCFVKRGEGAGPGGRPAVKR
jgi:hypothetical protein